MREIAEIGFFIAFEAARFARAQHIKQGGRLRPSIHAECRHAAGVPRRSPEQHGPPSRQHCASLILAEQGCGRARRDQPYARAILRCSAVAFDAESGAICAECFGGAHCNSDRFLESACIQ